MERYDSRLCYLIRYLIAGGGGGDIKNNIIKSTQALSLITTHIIPLVPRTPVMAKERS